MSNETDAKTEQRERQLKQAEELLFSGKQEKSPAKELFNGRFSAEWFMPYARMTAENESKTQQKVSELKAFCDEHLDAEKIDANEEISRELMDGLAKVGLLGMTAPEELGGHAFSQMGYCRLLEEIGYRCGSTSIFVNAHHSIGMRALLLFGTDEQKKWLPDMVQGKKIGAFALTEVAAGSDASNVQTTAVPSEDGSHFILNGSKRYITNGGFADILTVMAQTPVEGSDETAVTAFLVTPDMPGFNVIDSNMRKLGVRGTAQAKLEFKDMKVPKENILGKYGKGLRLALTVLDFGRTTFGACCTGGAKAAFDLAVHHANTRIQFGEKLGEFELVKKKISEMAASIYAMEAMTTVTAGLIDSGMEDYMLETAMLKVYASEALWTIVNDSFQIHGGAGYFNDSPMGRMLRDARINQIGEGANEVLLSFIALVGMKEPGEGLKDVLDAALKPWSNPAKLLQFTTSEISRRVSSPTVEVRHASLQENAKELGQLIRQFALQTQKAMIHHKEEILDRQLVQEPIAKAAMELFASSCVLSRLDAELNGDPVRDNGQAWEKGAGRLFLKQSARRVNEYLTGITVNENDEIVQLAKDILD